MLEPVFEMLHERKALLLFMHPTSGCVQHMQEPAVPLSEYPWPMLEFFFDTTRAVVNLLLSGTVDRYPGVQYLAPHCRAALPRIERFTSFSTRMLQSEGGMTSERVKHLFKTSFYVGLAGFPFPYQLHGLLCYTDTSRLLYGSDYPYTPGNAISGLTKVMDAARTNMVSAAENEGIYHGIAERVLKRYARCNCCYQLCLLHEP